jgi:hypothetical protein
MKMLGKKRDLSEHEKNAKMDVMNEMRNEAASAMHGKLGGLKKVSVMSDSSEGLKHGLDKAKQILPDQEDEEGMAHGGVVGDEHEMDEMTAEAENPYHDNDMAKAEHAFPDHQDESEEEDPDHEGEESPEEELSEEHPSNEGHGMSSDEIDERLKHLMALKEKLSKN